MHHGRGFAVRPSDEPPDDEPLDDGDEDDDPLDDGVYAGSGLRLGRSCAVDPVDEPAGWLYPRPRTICPAAAAPCSRPLMMMIGGA